MTATRAIRWLRLSDDELLSQCDVHTYRASGPGGQHRNKVESAVRILHRPTGVSAVAAESRSQLENRPRALRRLREAIAVEVRGGLALESFEPPPELASARTADGRMRLNERNPVYPIVAATVLELLATLHGRVADAARLLGMSTHHLTQFLAEHPRIWQAANRIRGDHGQRPLRAS